MKGMKTGLVVLLCLMITSFIQISARDWEFRAGAQAWAADWSYQKAPYLGFEFEEQSDTAIVFGPSIQVFYGEFGLGFNFYSGSFDVGTGEYETSKDRRDLDLYFSYHFLSYFNAFIGYKLIDFDLPEPDGNMLYNLNTTVDGLAIGLAAGIPFGESNFFGYGNLFFMPKLSGEESWEPSEPGFTRFVYDVDAEGYNAELGIGYLWDVAENVNLSIKGGYRLQSFKYEFDVDIITDADDDYNGFRLEIFAIW